MLQHKQYTFQIIHFFAPD